MSPITILAEKNARGVVMAKSLKFYLDESSVKSYILEAYFLESEKPRRIHGLLATMNENLPYILPSISESNKVYILNCELSQLDIRKIVQSAKERSTIFYIPLCPYSTSDSGMKTFENFQKFALHHEKFEQKVLSLIYSPVMGSRYLIHWSSEELLLSELSDRINRTSNIYGSGLPEEVCNALVNYYNVNTFEEVISHLANLQENDFNTLEKELDVCFDLINGLKK